VNELKEGWEKENLEKTKKELNKHFKRKKEEEMFKEMEGKNQKGLFSVGKFEINADSVGCGGMNYKRVLRKTHRCGFCGEKTTRTTLKKIEIDGGYYRLKCLNCNAIMFTGKIGMKKHE